MVLPRGALTATLFPFSFLLSLYLFPDSRRPIVDFFPAFFFFLPHDRRHRVFVRYFFLNNLFLRIFQVVLLLCRLRPQYPFSRAGKSSPPLMGMVGLAIALPPPSVHEIRLETDMFVTRINFDFRIAHCEPK